MELRLIIGYTLLLIFIGVLAGTGFVRWRRARNEFKKRWGKQKLRQGWVAKVCNPKKSGSRDRYG